MSRAKTVRLSPEGVDRARAKGWTITEHGRVDTGARVGPCVACRRPTVRYGPLGQPHCPACRPGRVIPLRPITS